MDCPHCNTSNPVQARFCLGCGRLLAGGSVCTTCHTLLPLHARYCFHCGAIVVPMAPQAAAVPGAVAQPAPVPAMPAPMPEEISPRTARPGAFELNRLLPARPLQEMLDSLRQYLPFHLFEPLERSPAERDLVLARKHLAALLKTVKTYLPRPVVLAPQPAGEPAGGLYRGTFLFVDVSGFTPLSERLSQMGQAGAEQITKIINDLFFDTVNVLFDHGGMLLKFGGDALLGLFPGEAEEALAQGALQAVQAASAMQGAMSKFAAIDAGGETRALRIKCGIASGPYFAAHIGTRKSMAYVTIGHTVNHADQAEGHAEPGEVVISQSTLDLLDDRVAVERRDEGFYLVRQVPPVEGDLGFPPLEEPPEGEVRAQISYLVERLDRLSPYLAAELLPRIVNNPEEVRITPDRRPVTVMFANYVGISDLIDDMGETHPELITRHLNDYFVHMVQVVEHYDGSVGRMDQYSVGDRLVVFFGAPRAHEDDPRLAVATALDMQEATRQHFAALQTPEGIYRFRQRIGINTGYLFAGNVGAPQLRQEYTLMGDDINMAARLMSRADWGEILISNKTEERLEDFDLEDRGELVVKGKTIPIPTFRVLGVRDALGRMRGRASTDAPLVDRGDELTALRGCGETFLKGRGQIVSIVGDSGLGKSRLARELKQWLFGAESGVRWLEGYALSFSEQVSYWLAVQIMRGALELEANARTDDVLFALWERCEQMLGKEAARDVFPYLAHLMDLPLEGEWAQRVEELDPHVRQKQTFWAARQFFKATARQEPIVIALDDLHWADEASLALVGDLLAVVDQAPLMFCLVFRQRHDKGCWRLRDRAASAYPHRYTEVALKPLAEAYSRQLLDELVPGAEFSPQMLQGILDKTAGNPFYLQEVVRSLQDDGAIVPDEEEPERWKITPRVSDIAVPDSLQGAILARIDRLTEDARQALQMASVIGRRFQAQVLWGLIQAEAELDSWLAQLERSDLIRPAELTPDPVYAFPDALVQEVAYESLLVQRRQEFHLKVGETLETIYANRLDQECELLAHHFGRSDTPERAIPYLEMAGHKAQAGFANETAVQNYSDLLELLGEREETWQRRFDILLRRQQIYGLTGKPDARQADLDAMLKLADDHGEDKRRSDTLNELADLCQWTGRYEEAEESAQAALEIKTRTEDPAGQAAALHQLGVLSYYRGDYAQAQPLLERAVALRRQERDPKGEAWSLMYLGMIHFFQGDYGQAAQFHNRALETAQERQDWFQEGIHLTNAARVSLRLGEYEQALEQFERSLEMKSRVGDRTGQGFSLFYVGLTNVYLGRADQAESALQASLNLRRQINDERGMSYSLGGLGLVALRQQEFEQAEDYFRQATELRAQLGLKAELIVDLSFLGQACLAQGRLEEAAEASAQAIALLAEQKDVEEVQQVYLNHFRILAARRDAQAGDMLQKAYKAMMDQADRIGDPDKRRSFLDNVRVNREILATIASGDWHIEIEETVQ